MPLSETQAQKLIAAAQEHARGLGIKVAVAVVDEGGLLQALSRMDGAFPLASQIAEAKAVGAAMWYRDGAALASVREQRPAFFDAVSSLTRLPIMPGDGSIPIRMDDVVLGAVGVSGAAAEQDRECAEAGVRAALDQ